MKGFAATTGKRINAAENDLLYVPRIPNGYGAIFCHGAGGEYSDSQRYQSGFYRLCQGLALAGYHVLSGEWGGAQTWGNDTVAARIAAARTFFMGLGLNSKMVLTGGSMGNLNIMRYMADHPENVVCGVGIIPAVDIVQIRDGNIIGAKVLIEGAWGLGVADPTPARGIPLGRVPEMTSVPWAGWYGGADTVTEGVDVEAVAAALGPDSKATMVDNVLDHSDALVSLMPWSDIIQWVRDRTP